MLTETVIIFSVLLGLLILISVLGGSVLPLENFADEVEMEMEDDEHDHMPEEGMPEEEMPEEEMPEEEMPEEEVSEEEMRALAEELASLPSDEEREKVMAPMSDHVKEVLHMMLQDMEPASDEEPVKEGFGMKSKKAPFVGNGKERFMGHGYHDKKKEPFMGHGHHDKKKDKEPFMMKKKEPFGGCGYDPKETFMAHDHKKEKEQAVEPFDGDVYAMY